MDEDDTLFRSEEWWRDHYMEIYNHGYEFRPRYHPNWKPSWTGSGKDFFDVEDGQPTIVGAHFPRYQYINANISYYISHEVLWMLHADPTASKSCLRRSTPKKDHMS